ncbi:MAG: hypothetical protein U0V02_18895 [Anaerolineales bacterium]
MRFFLKFGLILTLIIAFTSVILPRHYEMEFPRDPGLALDKQLRTNHLTYIEENQPQIVLLGDSTLNLGVDSDALAQQTGKSVYSIGIPGSASALWYLILKNNIAEAAYKPEYVLVVFRNTILTAPGYRVHGSYFKLVDEYAARNEPVFIEKSFVNLMNPLEVAAEKYLPLYVFRSDLRNGIDGNIRYFAPPLLGCDENCTDFALGEIFTGADLEPKALVDAVGAAESLLYTDELMDFDAQVNESYLPDMIRIAHENNIKLVFVRIKVESEFENLPEHENYLNSLRQYLKEQGAFLLDYGSDPRIAPNLLRDPLHLTEEGKSVFTQLVADGLKDLFEK